MTFRRPSQRPSRKEPKCRLGSKTRNSSCRFVPTLFELRSKTLCFAGELSFPMKLAPSFNKFCLVGWESCCLAFVAGGVFSRASSGVCYCANVWPPQREVVGRANPEWLQASCAPGFRKLPFLAACVHPRFSDWDRAQCLSVLQLFDDPHNSKFSDGNWERSLLWLQLFDELDNSKFSHTHWAQRLWTLQLFDRPDYSKFSDKHWEERLPKLQLFDKHDDPWLMDAN